MILWPKHVNLSMAAGQLRCAWGLGLSWRGAARPFCWRRISDDFWVLNLWNSGEWRHVLLSTNDMLYYAGLKHARIAFQNGSRVIVITTFYNITQARELRMHGFSRDPDPAWSRLLRVPLMPLRPRRADVEFYLNVAFTFKTHQNSITYYLPIKADLRWFVRCFQVFPGVSRCFQVFAWILSVCRWVLECTWYLEIIWGTNWLRPGSTWWGLGHHVPRGGNWAACRGKDLPLGAPLGLGIWPISAVWKIQRFHKDSTCVVCGFNIFQ